MSSPKYAAACALVAVGLSACGTSQKPRAGTIPPTAQSEGHARIDDPRPKHINCLRQNGLKVTKFTAQPGAQPGIQVGSAGAGPSIVFAPTPGEAQGEQIEGRAQSAEVIGSALVYPNGAPDSEMQVVEKCAAIGVLG